MNKFATLPTTTIANNKKSARNLPTGHLLINAADEIIYANRQARHFLGLLVDESLPIEQKFLPLVQDVYQCYPAIAWLGWPKRPSATTTRYLIFNSTNHSSFSLLKVEIVEQMSIDSNDIWVVTINLVESSSIVTTVTWPPFC